MAANIPSNQERDRGAGGPDSTSDAAGAIWHWDIPADALHLSKTAAEILGCSPTEAPSDSQGLLARSAPQYRDALQALLQNVRTAGCELNAKIGWSRDDGTVSLTSMTGMTVQTGHGVLACGTLTPLLAANGSDVPLAELGALMYGHASEGIVILDREGICVQANAAAQRILSLTRDELIGLPRSELRRSGSASPRQRLGLRYIAADDDIALELLGRTSAGAQIVALRDLREEREAERQYAFLAAIVQSSEDAIVGKDLNGFIQFWNPAAQRMFGYSEDETIGRHITLLIPPERHGEEDVILSRLRRGERIEHYQTIRLTKDGRPLDISLSVSPIVDRSGVIIGASKIARDITEQKQAEQRIRSGRELLDAVIDAAPIAVVLTDSNGLVQLWNPAATRMFGWSAQQINAPPAEDLDRFRREEFLSVLKHETSGDTIQGVETTVTRRDGSVAEVALWSSALRSSGADAPRMLTLAADIGDRRRAQRALREQEQRLRAALHASRTGTFRWDIRTNELQWDDNLRRLAGLPAGHPIQSLDQFIHIVHPDDREALRKQIEHCAAHGSDFEMDLRVVWPDGSIHWLYDVGQTVLDERGAPLYMTGACVDITHRKQSEQALQDSEERFRTLADNIAQFAWMANSEGWIFWYNQRWFDYTGTTLEQMQGWGWRTVHHPDHVESVVEKYRRCIAAGVVWEDTFPLRAADGSYRWFLSRAIPIRDSNGRVTRWFGTNTDITERRDMEEALKETDRRKDTFLATLAHELRNPLSPIVTGLELLRIAAHDPDKMEGVRLTMERQADHLVRLVDDLLEISRISRNKVQLRLEPVDLQTAVRNAVETVQPLLDRQRHILTVTLPDEPVTLRADPTRLAQIFANLLHNAAKYTPPQGHIELMAERGPGVLTVRIRDDGCGIPAAMLDRIFDMFSQVSSPESGREGLGIGLTLVKSLVELHGGGVRAHSAGLNCGSEFVLTLPLSLDSAQTKLDAVAGKTMSTDQRQRILVVDDNEDAAVSTSMLLEAMGNEVRTAYDGAEAITIAADFRPDVILLDLGMPKLNGYETARRLRREPWGEHMALIALTGWGQDQDRERTREAGFDHHLVKPVDPAALRSLLNELAAART